MVSDFLGELASLDACWQRCDIASLLLRSAYGEAAAAAMLGVSTRTLQRRCARAKRTVKGRAKSFPGRFCHPGRHDDPEALAPTCTP